MTDQQWMERYGQNDLSIDGIRVLTGFNANIDVIRDAEDLSVDISDVEPENHSFIETIEQMTEQIKYCMEQNESMEVDTSLEDPDIGPAEERIGGQAGIMTTFLERAGAEPVFYTPFISQYLVEQIPDTAVSIDPGADGLFVDVSSCINTQETKCNMIVEYGGEHPGRVIFSSSIDGFAPLFTQEVMERVDDLNKALDRLIISGHHSVPREQADEVFEKAEAQLRQIEPPVHLEYVYKDDTIARYVAERIMPYVESLGLDEHELRKLSELHEMDVHRDDELSISDAYHFCTDIMERYDLERVHLHTYRFHMTVVDEPYEVSPQEIRKAMVFAEKAAVATAGKGDFASKEDLRSVSFDHTEMNGIDDLERFGEEKEEEAFARTGIFAGEGGTAVVIPVLVKKHPERLVGLGDVISSAAFTAEVHESGQ